jgi:hypothetical protein
MWAMFVWQEVSPLEGPFTGRNRELGQAPLGDAHREGRRGTSRKVLADLL